MLDNIWFREQIEEAVKLKIPVFLDGDITLTETIDIGNLHGLRIEGSSNYVGQQNYRAAPCIVWEGPEDQPVFRSRGTGLFATGFSVHLANKASAVFHFVDQPGLADGKSYIEKVSVTTDHRHIYDFVRCGEKLGDGHCDTITISDCRTQHARSFLSTRNHQSMGHVIRSPHTFNSLIGLDLQAGGFVVVDGVWTSVADRLICRLGQMGANNGWVKIENLKVDSQTADQLTDFKIVEGNPSYCRFVVDGLLPSKVRSKWTMNQMMTVGPGVIVRSQL